MMFLFIPWDVWFTAEGVWWFNHKYTLGIDLWGLPIEEWLFFIIIPTACIFIYESLNYFFTKDHFASISQSFFYLYAAALIGFAFVYNDRLYPGVTFGLTALGCILLAYKQPNWIGRFLFMYLVVWIPFIVVNGSLTGAFTSEAVVNYNSEEFIGFRVITIPIEDSVYNMLMLMCVVASYEYLKKRAQKASMNT